MKKLIYSLIVLIALLAIAFWVSQKPSENIPNVPSNSNATTSTVSQVGIQSISNSSQTASAVGTISKTITWQTSAYPAGTGVDINLIRKTSDSPASYTLVKRIAQNAPNTGSYEWTPSSGDIGSDLYIEVTCPTSVSLSNACQVTSSPISTQ